ncbi:hypothetical protein OIU84_018023 [Salix udensis]|uniref:Pentatricopeptide repeat-containing protein n=1 Tax=Salix udensis TaxID=889485 RepID=A0AAD6PLM6_9ROSI|nr:hypothetical protein OIU84_018023 [Salix udensis]
MGILMRVLGFVKQMQSLGFYRLDQATLTTILSACDRPELGFVNKMVHCLAVLNGMQVFYEMLERNVITWTAIISGLVQSELYRDSLRKFVEMTNGMVEPNSLTYLSSLMACSGLQALREGCQIHGRLWKLGLQSDFCIESALMDMYSKCGSMGDALQIFESAVQLDEVSMTVILVGFAQNGI